MAKIRLTKNDLTREKEALRRYTRFLPTLHLKKRQLLLELQRADAELQSAGDDRQRHVDGLQDWLAVFGDDDFNATDLARVAEVRVDHANIAGTTVPVFREVVFCEVTIDLYASPLWVDRGRQALRSLITLDVQIEVLQQSRQRLADELRRTSQRVNLFEQVRIPETIEYVRKLNVFLGDQQTAAVVRGKIAKRKRERAAQS